MGRKRVGKFMNIFSITEHGVPIFEGTIDQVGNMLNMTRCDIYDAIDDSTLIEGKYLIHKRTESEISSNMLHDHLFNSDGSRRYEYRSGFPNRYKDASSKRFTPM